MAEPPQDPRAGTAFHRVARGFSFPFRALGYMFGHPRLWTYALIPMLVSIVLLGVLFAVLVEYNDDLTGAIWTRPEAWWQQGLWFLLYVVTFLVSFVVGAVSLPGLVASPFNDALSERTERLLLGTVREEKLSVGKLVRDVGKTVIDELLKIVVLLGGHVLLLPALLVPVVGQVTYPVLATTWTMLWLAAEYLEYPMSRNGLRFGDVARVVRQNAGISMGFGGAVFLILMIPLVNFLFVPVAVVGGTMLYVAYDGAGALIARSE